MAGNNHPMNQARNRSRKFKPKHQSSRMPRQF